jgi:ABC-type Mn2+/Zn2+ transport system ATPase subunit
VTVGSAEAILYAGPPPPPVGEPRLIVRDLHVSYGPTQVLTGAALDLAGGSIGAVVGPNGIGKSSLLGAIVGAIRHSGSVTLDGTPVHRLPRGRVAYLPQRVRLPSRVAVGEVLDLFGHLSSSTDRVELPDGFVPGLDRLVGELSGGQARRVALAATLSGAADLLVLDEPFANLDDEGRDTVVRLLGVHRDAGAAVLVASPTEVDLLTAVDSVLAVRDGIVLAVPPGAFIGRLHVSLWLAAGTAGLEPIADLPHVERVRTEGAFVGLECREDRAVDLLRALVGRGIPADRIRIGGPDEPGLRPSSPDPGHGQ